MWYNIVIMEETVKLLVSEAVGKGHPDKICDEIADAILDQCLAQDSQSRVACEVMASNRLIIVGGEITTTANLNIEQAVWSVLVPLGYKVGDFTIVCNINHQSPDIAKKVNKEDGGFGAGDQGITYGYATNETTNYLPIAYDVVNDILQELESARFNGLLLHLKADMKGLVELSQLGENIAVKRIILAIQHDPFNDPTLKTAWKDSIKHSVDLVLERYGLTVNPQNVLVNAGGDFIIGGPIGDTGLTGRKLQSDTYGCATKHGGGAFSGKDYTKVDRTGAYLCRWIAKNLVYNKICSKCEVGMVWQFGSPVPDDIILDCFGTNHLPLNKIKQVILQNFFDCNINQVVWVLGLNKPIYQRTSCYGHFGNPEFPWERTFKLEIPEK